MQRVRVALLIGLVVATTASAQTSDAPVTESPKTLDVSTAVIVEKHTEHQYPISGGCWLSEKTCIDAARRQEQLAEENRKAEQDIMTPQAWQLAFLTTAVAFAFGVGVVVGKFAK